MEGGREGGREREGERKKTKTNKTVAKDSPDKGLSSKTQKD